MFSIFTYTKTKNKVQNCENVLSYSFSFLFFYLPQCARRLKFKIINKSYGLGFYVLLVHHFEIFASAGSLARFTLAF